MQSKDLHDFRIGLNKDDRPEDIQPGEYTDALNMRTGSSKDQQGIGNAESLQSEIEILIGVAAEIVYYGSAIGGDFIYDGYPEVQIGNQVWMKKNWDYAYPGSKVYDDNEANRAIYGGLYTWEQINQPDFVPAGYRIPTEADINELIAYLGGIIIAGGKMKEVGEGHWLAPNTDADDSSGFTGLPGGLYDTAFSLLQELGSFWLLDATVPLAPVALTSPAIYEDHFYALWELSEGADGYYLDASTDPLFGSFVAGFNNLDVGNVLTYDITGLNPGIEYYFRVRSYNTNGSSLNSNVILTETSSPFKITIDTTKTGSASDTFILPLNFGRAYDCYIDWGDGGALEHYVAASGANQTHVYAAPGTYQIKISGTFPSIYFNYSGDRSKLITIDAWGNIVWGTMASAFYGCVNMDGNWSDAPDLSACTSLNRMFSSCSIFNHDFAGWDTSTITDMGSLLTFCVLFDSDISALDTSNVTNFYGMFSHCHVFNQSVATLNTSKAVSMYTMFSSCFVFNQSVANFDTSNVLYMGYLFQSCYVFNQSVANFDTSKVTDMEAMFFNCYVFNQSVANFDTSECLTMRYMFGGCRVFNQSLANFDTSKVTTMYGMFYDAEDFNQSLATFNTSNVNNMGAMFSQASTFNQSLAAFDTSKVTDMSSMFYQATAFNGDISTWDTSLVTTMSHMFDQAGNFNQSVAHFNTGNVTTMTYMFASANAFHQSIVAWDISKVTDMSRMFDANLNYNESFVGLDTSNVQNFSNMFRNCLALKQSFATFNLSSATNISNMFLSSNINAIGTSTNYDDTLVAWAGSVVTNGLSFHGGSSKYGPVAGAAARASLIADDGWTITDGGPI